MKYLVDFDRTLLDTGRFLEQVYADGRGDILITPEIWKHYQVRDFLYDDVLPWCASKPKESLHILTAMTPELGPLSCEFQQEKLHSGHFEEFVSTINFMIGMKGEAAAKIATQFSPHEPIIFIDDRLDQCLSVKEAVPRAHCFLMLREGNSSTTHEAVSIVHTLSMVDAIMKTRI